MILSYLPYWLVGYLIGSIPFAFLMARLKGTNIFEQGSGNPGATNTLVLFGKKAAVVVLVLDVLKGFVPTLVAAQISGSHAMAFWTAAGCVCGHAFSLFTKCKGGKALATAAGTLLYLYPVPLFVVIGAYILFAFLIRYIVIATTLVVVGAMVFFLTVDVPLAEHLALLTMVTAVLYRHLQNWERIFVGTEPKITKPVHEVTLERFTPRGQVMLRVGYGIGAVIVYAVIVSLHV